MHKMLRAESGLPPFFAEPAHMRSKTRILLRPLTVTALMLGAARPLSSQEFTPPVPLLEMTGHRGVVRFLQYLPPDGRNILSLSGHSLIVWDSKSGEEVIRLADGEPIFSFAAAADRVYVATSSSARILDISTADVVLEFDPAVYRLPVEKFSGANRSPGCQDFCHGATPLRICSMSSSVTLRA